MCIRDRHQALHGKNFGIGLGGADELGQPVGLGKGIVVEHDHILALGPVSYTHLLSWEVPLFLKWPALRSISGSACDKASMDGKKMNYP